MNNPYLDPDYARRLARFERLRRLPFPVRLAIAAGLDVLAFTVLRGRR